MSINIKAVVLGGLAVFVWGMISWMVLPWHKMTIHEMKNDQAVQLNLLQNVQSAEPGIYSVPKCEGDQKEHTGPFAMIAINPRGLNFSPMMMVKGLVIDLIAAFIMVLLLSQTSGLAYWDKVKFITTLGVVASAGYLMDWNWWGFATDYTVVGIVDVVFSWFLGGLVIAKLSD